ncbi:hypothetical protein [Streptomyces sp. Ag109_G2-15]|uniref:hypothetical protein n=1 Tax=Streptomyces sp. Ag109_G2-15 TaxID=1938850 RepID=UPI000BD557E6|nr:hypothetical protein [Streptomyces sp. Ag109_G2-15]SOD85869.1 hypothetical protein SAMN06272765_3304 [Streptomyces sp. Ag109_G2-15]
MPAKPTGTLVTLSPAALAQLPSVALVLALYASDYVHEPRPNPEKLAAFMVEGANRWGLPALLNSTCHLVAFWQMCADDASTSEAWAEHYKRFDNRRIIHCSLTKAQFAAVRRHLRAVAFEAVVA